MVSLLHPCFNGNKINFSEAMKMLKTISLLCRAEPPELAGWFTSETDKIKICLLLVFLGGSLYGLTLGIWRSPLQGVYVAIKFPLLIYLTMLGNGLINGMLAQLLGVRISFRQSFLAVIMSFALLTTILGSLSPLMLFLVYNLPPMGSAADKTGHAIFLLSNVALIAFAGVLANVHLYSFLAHICGSRFKALQVLCTWLAVNMFLGCQLSWNLRPFFGSPGLPVRFLRDDPFSNSFYEAVWRMVM